MAKLVGRVSVVLLVLWGIASVCEGLRLPYEPPSGIHEDAAYWRKIGLQTLKKKLATSSVTNLEDHKAKNIIIFVGDGMGMTTITAGRIFKGQRYGSNNGEEVSLSFDDFPHTGLAKTYNVDKQVPDSAGTATAMFCGVKTLYGVVGLDTTCDINDPAKGRVPSIMDWAQSVEKRTGIVTTTRVTHATPASTYANSYDRDWECDSKIPEDIRNMHVDIARQLVDHAPGKHFNVVMGGGLKPMGAPHLNEKKTWNFTGDTETVCSRTDGRNLVDEWLAMQANGSRTFVQTREQLMSMDTQDIEHVIGLFRNNHLTYKIGAEDGEPELKDMVEQAIKVLHRPNSNGYVLMVEGGRIDQAHHQNYARAALQEVLEFDKAIETAMHLTSRDDTLIIVTADHSHAMTFNGYPVRGNDILGFANKTANEKPYETLTYANGPGYDEHRKNNSVSGSTSSDNTWISVEELGHKRQNPTYRHMASFKLKDETHGGEDVVVFSSGPGSELIRGVFEQNYLAYVMSYAGCMGPAKDIDDSCYPKSNVEHKNLETSGSTSDSHGHGHSHIHSHSDDTNTGHRHSHNHSDDDKDSTSGSEEKFLGPWKLITAILCLLVWRV